MTWELPLRPPEPEDPLWFRFTVSLITATLVIELGVLGALAYYLLKPAR